MEANEMRVVFNKMAETWTNDEKDHEIRQALMAQIDINKGLVVADIGCGKGVMLPYILKTQPKKIYAIDISEKMLKEAECTFSDTRIKFINDDILTAPLPMLDVALIYNAYPHLMYKEALARKLAAHVKCGGTVVIAHSRSRHAINSRHKGEMIRPFSMPLKSAETELGRFRPYFNKVKIIDNETMYLVQMERQ